MKLLLNDKEIANFLASELGQRRAVDHLGIEHAEIALLEEELKKKKKKIGTLAYNLNEKEKNKFKKKIIRAASRDLQTFVDLVNDTIAANKLKQFNTLHKKIDSAIDSLGESRIFDLYRKSEYKDFIKGAGLVLDNDAEFIRRKNFTNYSEDCLIRNTVGNEQLLVTKIDKNYPMWFIDSGYTNFLEPNKKWHRLVRNHLHYGKMFEAPASRMENFKKFPVPWRKDGDTIYIIEPGPFAASIFHCDLKTWKYDVEKELRKYTDKKIKFREKAPKRERTRLFDELLFSDDYYCVISINSNAATEAIWAGIPAITLGTHITNPVTRNKLSDINDLYYGPINDWLAMLSYSQFTKEELMNGTALKLIRKYQNV